MSLSIYRIKALGTLPSPVSTAAFVVRAIGGNEVNSKQSTIFCIINYLF